MFFQTGNLLFHNRNLLNSTSCIFHVAFPCPSWNMKSSITVYDKLYIHTDEIKINENAFKKRSKNMKCAQRWLPTAFEIRLEVPCVNFGRRTRAIRTKSLKKPSTFLFFPVSQWFACLSMVYGSVWNTAGGALRRLRPPNSRNSHEVLEETQ